MTEWENPGYPIEHHRIETEDHYVLTLTRIPGPIKGVGEKIKFQDDVEKVRKPAVLFVHGFLCSSEHWLINSPDKVLPYRLVEEGYDIWLCNFRGTPLSRGHTTIPKESKSRKYWNFSVHEIAQFDIPAIIDYVLTTTGNESLCYVGHSMGCGAFGGFLSLRPEYSSKIHLMIALAPCVYGSHITNIFFRPFIHIGILLGKSNFLRNRELCGKTAEAYGKVFFPWTRNYSKAGRSLIEMLGVRFGGFGKTQIVKDQMEKISTQFPAPTSIKVFCHGVQGFKSGCVRHYDYGRTANLKRYGQPIPPEYAMENANVPIAIFYSEDDKLCPPKDVIRLSTEVPNLIGLHRIDQPDFCHFGFLLGKDVNNLVYDRVMEIIRANGNSRDHSTKL